MFLNFLPLSYFKITSELVKKLTFLEIYSANDILLAFSQNNNNLCDKLNSKEFGQVQIFWKEYCIAPSSMLRPEYLYLLEHFEKQILRNKNLIATENANILLEKFKLQTWIINFLDSQNIHTIGQLVRAYEDNALYEIKGLDNRSLSIIKNFINHVKSESFQKYIFSMNNQDRGLVFEGNLEFDLHEIQLKNQVLPETQISDLQLGTRATNRLLLAGIFTVKNLITAYENDEIYNIYGLGPKYINYIWNILQRFINESFDYLNPQEKLTTSNTQDTQNKLLNQEKNNIDNSKYDKKGINNNCIEGIWTENIEFPTRITNHLLRAGIITVNDLINAYKRGDIHKIKGLGPQSIKVLTDFFEKNNSNDSNCFHQESLISRNMISPQYEQHYKNKYLDQNIGNRKISEFINDNRLIGYLERENITTIGSLYDIYTNGKLISIKGIGDKTYKEVQEFFENVTELNREHESNNYFDWAQMVEPIINSFYSRDLEILTMRYGVKPYTLEFIAREFGITRERVRQIEKKIATKFLTHIYSNNNRGLTEKIINKIEDNLSSLNIDRLNELLKTENLLGEFLEPKKTYHIENISPFEVIICWIRLVGKPDSEYFHSTFHDLSNYLTTTSKVSLGVMKLLQEISSEQKHEILRKVNYQGGVKISDAQAILSLAESDCREILLEWGLVQVIDDWYSYGKKPENTTRIPIITSGNKMLSMHNDMDLDLFMDGVRKFSSRFFYEIAPQPVFTHSLKIFGFHVENNTVSINKKTITAGLSNSELLFIKAIKENGNIASLFEISQTFINNNKSFQACAKTAQFSPIIEKYSEGMYKIRGDSLKWEEIVAAKERQEKIPLNIEFTHCLDGTLKVLFTVNTYAYLAGVINSPRLDPYRGKWLIDNSHNVKNEIVIDEGYLRGLKHTLIILKVNVGDRVELILDVRKRSIEVRKIIND